jgi:hypothetical protein
MTRALRLRSAMTRPLPFIAAPEPVKPATKAKRPATVTAPVVQGFEDYDL